eukprot:COSAG02_NODE_3248_length_7097_cov_2.679194_6_plen_45_part_00
MTQDKIFALGVNGVYHDEYAYSIVSFTCEQSSCDQDSSKSAWLV